MKKLMVAFAAAVAIGAFANEARNGKTGTENETRAASCRITVGGFGRGNVRTSMGGGSERNTLWGPEMEMHWNAYENEDFRLWLGMGGAFSPRREVYGRKNSTQTSEHQVSNDGYVTYDFSSYSSNSRSVDLATGEFRLLCTPEWKVSESFSVGGRFGVAFDWLQAKCKTSSVWAWNSRFQTNIPGLVEETDVDEDSGRNSNSYSKTEFAAYGILGLEATYMLTEYVGLYALCDWRIGNDAEFDCGSGTCKVDMDGWYAAAGVVVQF